jgi:ligand-binding sensor domain-containing protein
MPFHLAVGPDHTLWLGTSGLSRYDPTNGEWQSINRTVYGVTDIVIGPDSALWIASGRDGVTRYNPLDETWQNWTSSDGLASDEVSSIVVGPDGAIWFGTGGGVSRYDSVQDTWRSFTAADGLVHNAVSDLAVGPDGALWAVAGDIFGLSSGSILSRYDSMTETWQSLDNVGGLTEVEVRNMVAGMDGGLWLGTWSGVVRFDVAQGMSIPWPTPRPTSTPMWGDSLSSPP